MTLSIATTEAVLCLDVPPGSRFTQAEMAERVRLTRVLVTEMRVIRAQRDAAVAARQELAAAVQEEREARDEYEQACRAIDDDRCRAASVWMDAATGSLDALLRGAATGGE